MQHLVMLDPIGFTHTPELVNESDGLWHGSDPDLGIFRDAKPWNLGNIQHFQTNPFYGVCVRVYIYILYLYAIYYIYVYIYIIFI